MKMVSLARREREDSPGLFSYANVRRSFRSTVDKADDPVSESLYRRAPVLNSLEPVNPVAKELLQCIPHLDREDARSKPELDEDPKKDRGELLWQAIFAGGDSLADKQIHRPKHNFEQNCPGFLIQLADPPHHRERLQNLNDQIENPEPCPHNMVL